MLVGTVEVTLLVLLAAVLLGPLIAVRFRFPALLGLILLGVVFGPYGLGWLGRLGLVRDLGQIGILYLMFLAGLGFNLRAFMQNRSGSLLFGFLSFVAPFGLSVGVAVGVLGYEWLAALLVGSMWASNTLVAYPDVRAAGMADARSVGATVSAGVVADILALLVLAVATSQVAAEVADGDTEAAAALSLPLVITVPILAFFTVWVLPRLGAWFFTRVGQARVQRYVFALGGMAASAALAVAGGLEGIIGAFLAGLGLNRLVPDNGELMDRLDFGGSTLLIPAFLVSVGLNINPAAFVDLETVGLGLLFSAFVIVGKTVSAVIAARLLRYSFDEAGVMATLSFGQAASTLAIAQVGFDMGLFDQQVVNASVLAIVVTALATSYGTRYFIGRLPVPETNVAVVGAKVLVDVRGGADARDLIVRLSGSVAREDGGVIVPFSIPKPGQKEAGVLSVSNAESFAAAAGYDTRGLVRISHSFEDGVLELVEELDASLVVLSWDGPRIGGYLFETEFAAVSSTCPVPTIAAHLVRRWKRVVLVLDDDSVRWHKGDSALAAIVAGRLRPADAPILVLGGDETGLLEHLGEPEGVEFLQPKHVVGDLLAMFGEDDLLVVPSWLVRELSDAQRVRVATRLTDANVVVVAGSTVASASTDSPASEAAGSFGQRLGHAERPTPNAQRP